MSARQRPVAGVARRGYPHRVQQKPHRRSDGYALCLDTLIGVLPLADKDLHYRRPPPSRATLSAALLARGAGAVLPDRCGVVSAHGAGGRRAPEAIDDRTIIAATDAVLADYVGALKMGLDPAVSPIFARASHAAAETAPSVGSLVALPGLDQRSGAVTARYARSRTRGRK